MDDPFAIRSAGGRPRLLVSVRDASEAEAAIAADVIDVKDPDAGPLGAASTQTWAEVIDTVDGRRPITLALGDANDWNGVVPRVPDGVAAVKMGPAETIGQWQHVRRRFDEAAGRPLRWVAVQYGDRPLSLAQTFRQASAAGCRGVLIDTADKSGPPLTEIWSSSSLAEAADTAHRRRLWLALAGRLRLADFASLIDVADVIGVRSAVCGGDRSDSVSAEAVARCLEACGRGSSGSASPGHRRTRQLHQTPLRR